MRKAMYEAEVGDDVYGEDPTVNLLEKEAAALVGKEAALFVASGTMGNQVALMTHTARRQEVIVEEDTHIYCAEVGGMASLCGLQARPIKGKLGQMNIADIKNAIRADDIHHPETGLICLENTHNMQGGIPLPLNYMQDVFELARAHRIPLHLDGARLFNAAVALGCAAREITQYCDSVMFCLSKGLAAPVGSILAGSHNFILQARKNRKMMGGGLRQAGFLAAAGLVALHKMVGHLAIDHENATLLAKGLTAIPGLTPEPAEVLTNMVFLNVEQLSFPGSAMGLAGALKKEGILTSVISEHRLRLVTHKDLAADDIVYTLERFREVLAC